MRGAGTGEQANYLRDTSAVDIVYALKIQQDNLRVSCLSLGLHPVQCFLG